MAERVAGLYIDLGLNSEGFNSGLREAGRALKSFGGDAESKGRDVTRVFADAAASVRASLAGVSMLAGGVAAVGATTVVSQLRSTSAALAEIGAEAKKAGVSAEELQELGYAAQQVKISTDALTDGLKEMQLRADEFALTGKGSGAEAFERLGYTADVLKEKLKDPAALFKEIIERLKQLDTAAQIRIADEIFGGSGEQIPRFLGEGVKSIDAMIARGRELGIIINNDMIKKAGELDAKFNELAMVVDMRLKGAVISVAAKFDDWATATQEFLTWVGNWKGWEYFRMAGDTLGFMNKVLNAGVETPTLIDKNQPAPAPTRITIAVPGKVTDKPKTGRASAVSSRLTPGQEFERSLDSIREQIAALEREQAALGKTTLEAERLRMEHELLAEARRLGVAITPEIEANIAREAAAYAQAADNLEQAAIRIEDARALQDMLGQSLASSMSGLIDGTKTLNDVVKDLVGNLADAAMQAAILGQGPLAGLMGGGSSGGLMGALFSGLTGGGGGSIGLYNTGGYTGAGGRLEPAGIVHRGEYVFDQAATSRIGVQNLEAMRRGGLPGYAAGGFVGGSAGLAALPDLGRIAAGISHVNGLAGSMRAGGAISISAPLTINAPGANMTEAQMQQAVAPMFAEHTRQLLAVVPRVVDEARVRTVAGRRT